MSYFYAKTKRMEDENGGIMTKINLLNHVVTYKHVGFLWENLARTVPKF